MINKFIKKDVCIIGGGIAGLFAGLYLAKGGFNSIIIEKRHELGGLVGSFKIKNRTFTIACNDFGKGFERECRALGVNVEFKRPKTRLVFDNNTFEFPFSFKSLISSFPFLPKLIKTFAGKSGAGLTLKDFFDKNNIRNATARDLLNPLSYPLGLMEDQISIDYIRNEKKDCYGYGYSSPRTPKYGPKALINALLKKYRELGGEVITGLQGELIDGEKNQVVAGENIIDAREVITSQGRWNNFPKGIQSGLSLGSFLISLNKDIFPKRVHTLAFFPPKIAEYMNSLNSGVLPDRFGCHIFRSDLEASSESRHFNIMFYLPRGIENLDEWQLVKVKSFVFSQIEKMVPGFQSALDFCFYLSPADFKETHGLSSLISELQVPTWVQKPTIFDSETGLYHIGNSVGPPGYHAGQAILSAKLAAMELMDKYC